MYECMHVRVCVNVHVSVSVYYLITTSKVPEGKVDSLAQFLLLMIYMAKQHYTVLLLPPLSTTIAAAACLCLHIHSLPQLLLQLARP